MRKQIIEFRRTETGEESDFFEIELGAYELSTKENQELRRELEEQFHYVVYTFIDSDSFRCTIMNAKYDDLKMLEKHGWSF